MTSSIQPARPLVCYVTDRKSLAAGANLQDQLLAKVHLAAASQADWIQIREKDLPTGALVNLVRDAARIASGSKTRILVNDRLDAAIAAGAAGVHLGGDSMPAREIVRWCRSGNAPADFLVGVSCHRIEEARDAENCGVDYVFFGSVFDTPSKRSFGEPQGVARLAEACRAVHIRVIAIGGITEENATECTRAGAAGIAAIRLFQNAKDLPTLEKSIAFLRQANN